jgi:hypothetical protein
MAVEQTDEQDGGAPVQGRRRKRPFAPNVNNRSKRADGLTGGVGRVPVEIICDTTLTVFERFLIAYLCIHRAGFGINHRRMLKVIRQLGGRKMVQAAIRRLRDRQLIERKRRPGGYAVHRLTFAPPTRRYVVAECQLFDGTLTAREIVLLLYLRSRRGQVQPWQMHKVLGHGEKRCGRSVLNRCLVTLKEAGFARNVGKPERPLWVRANLPKVTLPKVTRTRKIVPPRKQQEAAGELAGDCAVAFESAPSRAAAMMDEIDRTEELADRFMAAAHEAFQRGDAVRGTRFVATADAIRERVDSMVKEYFAASELAGELNDEDEPARSPSPSHWPAPPGSSACEMGRAA